ncbi:MAG: hypothetical protein WBZ36_01960 [Candidatus Nitrosopolaris sp.]
MIKRRDLCVRDCNLERVLKTAEILGLDEIGAAAYDGKARENVIYRLNTQAHIVSNYPYLVVSDKIEDLPSPELDLFIVRDYARVKHIIKKRVRARIGLEVFLADIRTANGSNVGKWFEQLRGLYKLCHSINCQFILSSGANSPREMIPARCFDSLLELCDVRPEKYWQELEEWLKIKLGKRCYTDVE